MSEPTDFPIIDQIKQRKEYEDMVFDAEPTTRPDDDAIEPQTVVMSEEELQARYQAQGKATETKALIKTDDQGKMVNSKGQPICGAKRRNGETCMSVILGPSGRCRMHGGASPRGIAAGAYKHGKYSKVLPTGLLDNYRAARSDPELLALGDDIAVVEARIGQVMAEIRDSGMTSWDDLEQLAANLKLAIQSGDPLLTISTTDELYEALVSGREVGELWDEILHLFERKRKLTESEHRRQVAMYQVLKSEEVLHIMDVLANSVREHVLKWVDDKETRDAILRGVQTDITRVSRT